MIDRIELHKDNFPPYGYYNIRKVYTDGSFWILSFVDKRLSEVAKHTAENIAITLGVVLYDKTEEEEWIA